jgi:hypothetical protein
MEKYVSKPWRMSVKPMCAACLMGEYTVDYIFVYNQKWLRVNHDSILYKIFQSSAIYKSGEISYQIPNKNHLCLYYTRVLILIHFCLNIFQFLAN